MNTKAAIGIVAALIILVGAYFLLNRPSTPAAFTAPSATSTDATATSSLVKPSSAAGYTAASTGTKPVISVVRTSAFDQASLTSSSPRPIITGTANVDHVGIVVTNSAGVGIAGSYQIPVTGGKWSFSAPQALPPGSYTLSLIDGGDIVTGTLVVKGS